MLSLTDSKPCAARALKLRKNFNISYLESLQHILEACQEAIEPPVFQLIEKKLLSLSSEKKLNGFLYVYNAELIQAIEDNNIDKIRELFSRLSEENFQTKDFFSNFSHLPSNHQNMFRKIAAYEYPVIPDFTFLSDETFNVAVSNIQKALKIIKIELPELSGEIDNILSEILLFRASAPEAGSSFDLFGIIYANLNINRSSIVDVIDFIVHENAHLYLYLICCQDPLTLNDPEERYKAPFREDARPVSGIYHATFVLMRLIYTLDILIRRKILSSNEELYSKKLIKLYIEKFFISASILKNNAKFTELGRGILTSCENFVRSTNNSN